MKRWFIKKSTAIFFPFKLLPIWNEDIPLTKSRRPGGPERLLSTLVSLTGIAKQYEQIKQKVKQYEQINQKTPKCHSEVS